MVEPDRRNDVVFPLREPKKCLPLPMPAPQTLVRFVLLPDGESNNLQREHSIRPLEDLLDAGLLKRTKTEGRAFGNDGAAQSS